MKLTKNQTIIVLGGVAILLLLGILVVFFGGTKKADPEVKLSVWGVEPQGNFQGALDAYKQLRPNVTIEYTEVSEGVYYSKVVDAMAEGTGPDAFMIKNSWLPMAKSKLLPAPDTYMTLEGLRTTFPTVVEQNFVDSGKVYALPLGLDTLGLFYNKDIFDQASLLNPPKTWSEFSNDVAAIKKTDQSGKITLAAAALGASNSTVNAGTDVLQLLLMQNLAQANMQLVDSNGVHIYSDSESRGQKGFDFYLQFANPNSSLYTWNDLQGGSLDAFAAGKLAMVFGYPSDASAIREKSPYLNFRAAQVPQIEGGKALNLPSYWGLAVSKQSQVSGWAWDFISYMTKSDALMGDYAAKSGHMPALNSLVSTGSSDPDKSVFIKQIPTARAWYNPNEAKVTSILNSAIQNVLTGANQSSQALGQAEAQISGLFR